ncbi:FkbM family methyltransferase [Bacillus pinisoli]|uniref:FkbM family methyltransferase n=1 Tax=Bacillus pinisoli TaxID=2901866 RepID=UPI001FF5C8D2|nr:FkbM family methyltransferase [Bacillus pinisoli]
MLVTKDQWIETTLEDGSILNSFDDYIGKIIKDSKSYYEKNVLEFFIDYIPVSAVIYDLGANIGNHTLYFSKYTNAEKIFAFEPSKETYKLLDENIKRNQLKNVQALNLGVGNKTSKATLVANKENMGASFLTLSDEGDIEVVSLDSLDLPSPDFMKIDVEGFEYQVLSGATKLLKETKPVIWIEIFEGNYQEVDSLLYSLGYIQIDRWYENFIYVNPNDSDELLRYVNGFKKRPLHRFTEQSKITNRKYRNVTTRVGELNKMLEQSNNNYQKVKEQNVELNQKINELMTQSQETKEEEALKKNSEYQHQLKLVKLENEHLGIISDLKVKIALLEMERRNILAFLGGEGDIISNILKLQAEIKTLQEDKNCLKDEYYAKKEEVSTLKLKLEIAANTEKKDQEITDLKYKLAQIQERIAQAEEHNVNLGKHKAILTKRLEEQLEQLKNTEKILKDKSLQIDALNAQMSASKAQVSNLTNQIGDLMAQKVNLEKDLRDEMIDKINLLSKEEEFILKLEHEVIKNKKLEHEKEQINKQYNQLIKKNNELLKKYNALSSSKLGKLTVEYWKIAKKWAKRGK